MIGNLFTPQTLVGRKAELQQVSQILAADGDLMLAGVPGSGRRTLVRCAAKAVGAKIIEIDCLRAIDSSRFLQLLAEGILQTFQTPADLALIQRWSIDQPITLEESLNRSINRQTRLVWQPSLDTWNLFQRLLTLPQVLAEGLNCRVVMLFQNFPHIRSWDRTEKWQSYLRQEIQRQSRVSYALIATVADSWVQHSNMQVVLLGPLNQEDIADWVVTTMARENLQFAPESAALQLFLNYVQGHIGDAIALAQRLWLNHRALGLSIENWAVLPEKANPPVGLPEAVCGNATRDLQTAAYRTQTVSHIDSHHVHRSALALVADLSLTFESLILLLPPSQVRVLESLALDPTDSPHSREYIQKHQLSRGGGLQGALASLEQKGLVYGSEYGYRITMPFLALWLKHRLA